MASLPLSGLRGDAGSTVHTHARGKAKPGWVLHVTAYARSCMGGCKSLCNVSPAPPPLPRGADVADDQFGCDRESQRAQGRVRNVAGDLVLVVLVVLVVVRFGWRRWRAVRLGIAGRRRGGEQRDGQPGSQLVDSGVQGELGRTRRRGHAHEYACLCRCCCYLLLLWLWVVVVVGCCGCGCCCCCCCCCWWWWWWWWWWYFRGASGLAWQFSFQEEFGWSCKQSGGL